jgi:hypothetical protein
MGIVDMFESDGDRLTAIGLIINNLDSATPYPTPVIHNVPNNTYLLCYVSLHVTLNTAPGHTY